MGINKNAEAKALRERAEMLMDAGNLDEAAFFIWAAEEMLRTPFERKRYSKKAATKKVEAA